MKPERVVVDEAAVRALVEARDGPRAAAWLARTHRRQLHRSGAIEFRIVAGAILPPWFAYAVKGFQLHPKTWKLEADERHGFRVFRLIWRDWLRWSAERVLRDGRP